MIKGGPTIINDGLVLCLDAHDAKSYAGEPTTNNLDSSDRANANTAPNSNQSYSSITATKEVVNYSSDRPHVYRFKSTNATGYLSWGYNSTIQNQSGSVYAFSFDYKVVRADSGTGTALGTGSFFVYGNGYKIPNSSNIASNISSSEVELSDGWKRVTKTYTCGYTGYNQTRQDLSTGDSGDFEVLIDNIQFEDKTYSTPFANLSRSAITSFLIHGNVGSGTTFEDSSPNKITVSNQNSVSHGGTSNFGGSAIQFSSSSSQQLTSASTDVINFGTGDWTIEFWFNMTNGSTARMHALSCGPGNTNNIDFNFNDGNAFWLYWNSGGSPNIIFGNDGDYGDGNWHHLMATRASGMVRVWVDGVHKGSNNYSSSTSMGQTASIYVGGKSGVYWDGFLDEIRIIKGTALWSGGGNFAVPVERFKNGAWLDRSGNENNGNFINEVGTATSHYRDGQVIMPVANSYLDFDGTDQYITIPSLLNQETINASTTKTIILWLNVDSYGFAMPFSTGQNGNNRIYYWTQSSLNTWRIGNYTSTTDHSTLPSAGTWFCTAIVINGLSVTGYLNGVQDYTGSYTAFTTQDFAVLGRHGNLTGVTDPYYYNGKIGQVLVYNKALTAAEVLSNYNATKGRF